MFIIEPIKKEQATGELKILYKMIEKSMGFVPPHFELFASIDIEEMKEFMLYNQKMLTHPNIDKNILPHLRLAIAQKECRSYCINFNTTMLSQGEYILNARSELLKEKVLKALAKTNEFGKSDIAEVKKLGYTDKDLFDLLIYATNFMAKSKMIEIYLKEESK